MGNNEYIYCDRCGKSGDVRPVFTKALKDIKPKELRPQPRYLCQRPKCQKGVVPVSPITGERIQVRG